MPASLVRPDYVLADNLGASSGTVFLTGTQALIRLALMQGARDKAAGIGSRGFISGYRGSPLGGYDQQLFAARKHLEQYNIKFQPGVNEDLAATAIWGSQQLNLSPGAKYDGAVGIWYGKGPGVDRCGDVFRHGNAAGSARNGGVLCLAGDDHGAHRDVPGGEPLGAGDDVRVEGEPGAREPLTEPPEPGDHLVGDEQDAGVAADLAHRVEVSRRRSEDAARASRFSRSSACGSAATSSGRNLRATWRPSLRSSA